jgi:hypothetical protein
MLFQTDVASSRLPFSASLSSEDLFLLFLTFVGSRGGFTAQVFGNRREEAESSGEAEGASQAGQEGHVQPGFAEGSHAFFTSFFFFRVDVARAVPRMWVYSRRARLTVVVVLAVLEIGFESSFLLLSVTRAGAATGAPSRRVHTMVLRRSRFSKHVRVGGMMAMMIEISESEVIATFFDAPFLICTVFRKVLCFSDGSMTP